MPTPLFILLVLAGVAFGALLIAYASHAIWRRVSGNFHEVVRGEYYRAAYQKPGKLVERASRVGAASVINLLGRAEHRPWWREEVAAVEGAGMKHFDVRLESNRELPMERVVELIELLRAAPKPVLVHCKAGADRTGLATALYLLEVKGQTPDIAGRAIALRFGHAPNPINGTGAIRRTWRAWLASRRG